MEGAHYNVDYRSGSNRTASGLFGFYGENLTGGKSECLEFP